jgi:hypothetical protein
LNDVLNRLTLVSVTKGKPCTEEQAIRRQKADALRIGNEILIRPKSWKPSIALKELLIKHHILKTQRKDVATLDRKIMGIPGKPRYYVIDEETLAKAAATREN